jgi:hypothetical protein
MTFSDVTNRNGCSLAALISAMLNIINEVIKPGSDNVHLTIGIILALATLLTIWTIDRKRNGGRT